MGTIHQANSTQLHAICRDGSRAAVTLAEGASVLVGSSATCGLRLVGHNIARCHCLVSFEQGALYVQDWASPDGTRIDEVLIDGRVEWMPQQVLHLGDAEVHVGQPAESLSAEDTGSPAVQQCQVASEAHLETPQRALWETQGECVCNETLPQMAATDACQSCESGWLDDPWQNWTETASFPQTISRDVDYGSPDENVEGLIARIDELLDEISERDNRLAGLHELLLATEEANQAQLEEHRQINAWVDDLERHIEQQKFVRESELNRVREELVERTAELTQCRQELRESLRGDTVAKQFEEKIARLQAQNDQLAAERADYLHRITELERSYADLTVQNEQAIREERIQLAHERADLSRLKCELAQRIANTEERLSLVSKNEQEADLRTRALREHLREIHAAEQRTVVSVNDDSISTRVSRLWKRISSER